MFNNKGRLMFLIRGADLLVIIVCCVIMISCSNSESFQKDSATNENPVETSTANDNNVTYGSLLQYIEYDSENIVDAEKITNLYEGMPIKDLIEIIGNPADNVGFGRIILRWNLSDGNSLLVDVSQNEQGGWICLLH